MKFSLFVILSLWTANGLAHVSGFTETSIQIAQPGIRIIYTTPADNLLEIRYPHSPPVEKSGGESARVDQYRSPDHYSAAVANGWAVNSDGRNCLLGSVSALELDTIRSYQYILDFKCPQGMRQVDISYRLFTRQWQGHQNFARIFMADEQMRMRFTFAKTRLDIAVDEQLKKWNKSLDADFFRDVPDRGYNVEQ